ncbi:translation initiation factor IF-2-like [Homarus americanus]|uniref:translation initiation factor IF-2-like n=1 Tax=Homarus americanus TaxID=6706 RepID=UPI001C43F2D6|nr:translation initiation factor IF-2-like [Homarus americanus]
MPGQAQGQHAQAATGQQAWGRAGSQASLQVIKARHRLGLGHVWARSHSCYAHNRPAGRSTCLGYVRSCRAGSGHTCPARLGQHAGSIRSTCLGRPGRGHAQEARLAMPGQARAVMPGRPGWVMPGRLRSSCGQARALQDQAGLRLGTGSKCYAQAGPCLGRLRLAKALGRLGSLHLGQPGSVMPGARPTCSGRPVGHTGQVRLGHAQQGSGWPCQAASGWATGQARLGHAWAGQAGPCLGRPGWAMPGRPGWAMPGQAQGRVMPGAGQASHVRAGQAGPCLGRSGWPCQAGQGWAMPWAGQGSMPGQARSVMLQAGSGRAQGLGQARLGHARQAQGSQGLGRPGRGQCLGRPGWGHTWAGQAWAHALGRPGQHVPGVEACTTRPGAGQAGPVWAGQGWAVWAGQVNMPNRSGWAHIWAQARAGPCPGQARLGQGLGRPGWAMPGRPGRAHAHRSGLGHAWAGQAGPCLGRPGVNARGRPGWAMLAGQAGLHAWAGQAGLMPGQARLGHAWAGQAGPCRQARGQASCLGQVRLPSRSICLGRPGWAMLWAG